MIKDIIKYNTLKPRSILLYNSLSSLLDTEEKIEKVGKDKIITIMDWFNETGSIYRGGDAKTRRMFREIVGSLYGEHAYNILAQRPNLHFENISDYRVFDKSIVDAMGENFIHQLLNFDYKMVCKDNYNKIIDDLIKSEEKRGSFKFCYDLVRNEDEVYGYTKLFYTYSRYGKLIDDCYSKRAELTKEEVLTLKDVIINNENVYKMVSKRELALYSDMVKGYFEQEFEKDSSAEVYIEATLERFFGIFNPFGNATDDDFAKDDIEFNIYKRNGISMKVLREVYNIDRLITLEENAEELGRTPMLKKEELCILKLISAIDKIYQYSNLLSYEQEKIAEKLYRTLEANQDRIIRPSDVRSLLEKIPNLYAEDVKQSLTTIEQFEEAIKNNVQGIRVEYITRDTSFGTTIKVPVYHMEGYNYKAIVTSVQENLSGLANDYFKEVPKWYYTEKLDNLLGGRELAEQNRKEYRVTLSRQIVRLWFEKEGRANTCIACSYDTSKSPAAMEITNASVGQNTELDSEERVVYMMPKNTKIIAMGPTDTFSSSVPKNPNMSTLIRYTKFFTAKELENESFTSNYNEVDIERYTTTSNLRSSRVIPEALYKKGTEPTEMIIEHAVVMTEYLTKHGLKPKDYVFPIVMIDRSYYVSPEKVENTLEEIKDYIEKLKDLNEQNYDLDKNAKYINQFICSLSAPQLEVESATVMAEQEIISDTTNDNLFN